MIIICMSFTPLFGNFLSEYAKSDNLKPSKSLMWERFFRGVILAGQSTELKRECFGRFHSS